MKRPVNVVMVISNPNDESSGGKWFFHTRDWGHLYFITDEEVKEGDWYYYVDAYGFQQIFNWAHGCSDETAKYGKKIVASTNPNMGIIIGDALVEPEVNYKELIAEIIPQISNEFIAEYSKAGGIESVLVEDEMYMTAGWVPSYGNPDNNNFDPPAEMDYRIKTSVTNEVTIHLHL